MSFAVLLVIGIIFLSVLGIIIKEELYSSYLFLISMINALGLLAIVMKYYLLNQNIQLVAYVLMLTVVPVTVIFFKVLKDFYKTKGHIFKDDVV